MTKILILIALVIITVGVVVESSPIDRNARSLLLYKINEDKAIYIIDKMRKISLDEILAEKSSNNLSPSFFINLFLNFN